MVGLKNSHLWWLLFPITNDNHHVCEFFNATNPTMKDYIISISPKTFPEVGRPFIMIKRQTYDLRTLYFHRLTGIRVAHLLYQIIESPWSNFTFKPFMPVTIFPSHNAWAKLFRLNCPDYNLSGLNCLE